MKCLQQTFGCGNINQDSKATYLVVRRLSDLTNIIIPFFDKYSIMGNKNKDFEDFKSVAHLMNSKAHLTKEGIEQKWNEYFKKIKFKINYINVTLAFIFKLTVAFRKAAVV